ncbi:MAG TPA: mechanosensitive ion channel domain-containing protein [Candidatus Acidoferrales bacterium]|nr:mechanosensitive ion channel domain-containing protein [Candidatus Acidoferrales bacterium]
MRAQSLVLSALLALLVLAAVGLVLTNSWTNTAQKQAAKKLFSQNDVVDERPLQTAQQLSILAVTPEEQQLAQEALRISDHEVDMTFEDALREATNHPPVLSADAKKIQARIVRRQARVDAEQANVARLTQLVAKAPASKKDELQEELQLAQAQASLDQDELDDARQDFIRAGGDPRSKIQQALQEHEVSEVHANKEVAAQNAREAAVELTTSRNVVAEFRAWRAIRAKQLQLDQARSDSLARAATLAQSHQVLETKTEAQPQPASQQPPANSAMTGTATSPAIPAPAPARQANTTDAISRVRKLSDDQKTLEGFDRRIDSEQSLAAIYGKWSALVVGRERIFLRELLESVFWILLIACLVSLADVLVRGSFFKYVPDRKRFLTLRSVIMVSARVIGLIVVLLVIFGVPNQFATVLALAGAGLTVALKDFIVGFFGWFVLMGSNGIRPGDWVEINGVGGEVLEVGLLRTVLLETGDWSDASHPTGRKVTFVNSFAIEGHYFNFSTSGQWMWDELQVVVPADQDPYPVADEIKRIVAKETDADARLAEKEWERVALAHGSTTFKAEPAMTVRPNDGGVSVAIRYITRANQRHELRARLYRSVLELLHRKKIPQSAEAFSSQPVPDAE